MEIAKHYLDKFMLESNEIEGERGLNRNDFIVAKLACDFGFKNLEDILAIHKELTSHLGVKWSGKWRTVDVYVGSYSPPRWENVPAMMADYITEFPTMNSWQAHNDFEYIHPFQDFNGRMGRLIWLSKAIKEGYSFRIPFLHKYYYQTQENLNN